MVDIDTLWAAEIKRCNAEHRAPMTPEANFRRGVEAAVRAYAQEIADAERLKFIAENTGGFVCVLDRRRIVSWWAARPIPLSEKPTMLDQCRAAVDEAMTKEAT